MLKWSVVKHLLEHGDDISCSLLVMSLSCSELSYPDLSEAVCVSLGLE